MPFAPTLSLTKRRAKTPEEGHQRLLFFVSSFFSWFFFFIFFLLSFSSSLVGGSPGASSSFPSAAFSPSFSPLSASSSSSSFSDLSPAVASTHPSSSLLLRPPFLFSPPSPSSSPSVTPPESLRSSTRPPSRRTAASSASFPPSSSFSVTSPCSFASFPPLPKRREKGGLSSSSSSFLLPLLPSLSVRHLAFLSLSSLVQSIKEEKFTQFVTRRQESVLSGGSSQATGTSVFSFSFPPLSPPKCPRGPYHRPLRDSLGSRLPSLSLLFSSPGVKNAPASSPPASSSTASFSGFLSPRSARGRDLDSLSSNSASFLSPSSRSSFSSCCSSALHYPPRHDERRVLRPRVQAGASSLFRGASSSFSSSVFLSFCSKRQSACGSPRGLFPFTSALEEQTITRGREDNEGCVVISSSSFASPPPYDSPERTAGEAGRGPSSLKAFSSTRSPSVGPLLGIGKNHVGEEADRPSFCFVETRRRRRGRPRDDGEQEEEEEKRRCRLPGVASSLFSSRGGGLASAGNVGEENGKKKEENKKAVGLEKSTKSTTRRRRRGRPGGDDEEGEAEGVGEGLDGQRRADAALAELREFFERLREKERRRRKFLREKAKNVPKTLRAAYLDGTQVYLPHRYQHHRNPLGRRRVLRCFPPPRMRRFKLRVVDQEKRAEQEGEARGEAEQGEDEEQQEEEISFDPEDMDRFLDPPKPLSAYSWPDGCYLRIAYSGNRADDMDETGRRILSAIKSAGSSYLCSLPARLPIIRRRFSVPKSPHKHRKAIEQFEICERRRIIDVHRRDLLAEAERRGERGPRRWGKMEWPSRSPSEQRGSLSQRKGEEARETEGEQGTAKLQGGGQEEGADASEEEEDREDAAQQAEEGEEDTQAIDSPGDRSSLARTDVEGLQQRRLEKKKKTSLTTTGKTERHEATVKALLTIDLPELVHYNLRYEPYRLPMKARDIVSRLGHQPKWTSKYFEYLRDMKKKEVLIEELLARKFDYDRLVTWPNSFHVLRKHTVPEIEKMLRKAEDHYKERLSRRKRNLPPYRPSLKVFGDFKMAPEDLARVPGGVDPYAPFVPRPRPAGAEPLRKKKERKTAENKKKKKKEGGGRKRRGGSGAKKK